MASISRCGRLLSPCSGAGPSNRSSNASMSDATACAAASIVSWGLSLFMRRSDTFAAREATALFLAWRRSLRGRGSRRCGAGPILAAAQEAEHAAFDPDRVVVLEPHARRVGLAVLGIIDIAVPAAVAPRFHAEQKRQSHDRTAALCRIRIILVDAARFFCPNNRAAHRASARVDADDRALVFDQPVAFRACGERRRCDQQQEKSVEEFSHWLPPPMAPG